jgi:molecular chaperone DnaJ
MTTHYQVLGVRRDATIDEIKSAFREQSKQCHPDVAANGKTPTENLERFKRISAAAAILTNSSLRQKYDQEIQGSRYGRPITGSATGNFHGRSSQTRQQGIKTN